MEKIEIGEILYVLKRKSYSCLSCDNPYYGYGLFSQNDKTIITLISPTRKISDLVLKIREEWKKSKNNPNIAEEDLRDFRFKPPESFPEYTTNGGNNCRFKELSEEEIEEFAKQMALFYLF